MMKRSRPGVWNGALMAMITSLAAVVPVRANHVAVYGVGKERVYQQSSDTAVAAASSGGFRLTAFAVGTTSDSIVLVTVGPVGATVPQFLNPITGAFTLGDTAAFDTQADLDSNFASGAYTFTAMSSDFTSTEGPATLTLSGDAYPGTTPTANFTAAQAVNATNDFVLTWNAFAGAAANDYVQVTIADDSGNLVFNSGFPGQGNALPGTATSVTIPANTLTAGTTYTGAISFGHITSRDTTDYPGGVGVTTYTVQTAFGLKTTGSSGGIPTGDQPILMLSNPYNGQKNVAVNSPISFTFTAPMQPVQRIAWSANVPAANFTYTWTTTTNLTAKYNSDLPANATITWTLDPTVFIGQDGTPLMAVNNSGSFTTASGGSSTNNTPCTSGGTTNAGFGAISLFKSVRYLQTSAAAPVLDGQDAASFMASVNSPTTNPVTSATLQFNGVTKPLTNFVGLPELAGRFMIVDSFASEAAMNTAYPPGPYTFTLVRTTGTSTLTVNVPANVQPPTPQIMNLAQTLTFDPTANFTVQWAPFTGVAANDSIVFNLTDSHGTDFTAPDYCIPRPLANTATSILIPKNTFGTGGVMEGSLTFDKVLLLDTNSLPTIPAYAAYSKTTDFKAGSSTSTQPKLQNVVRLPNGTVQLEVLGTAGATLGVDASSDLKTWIPLHSELSVSGVLDYSDVQAAGIPYRFYRASSK